MGYYEINNFRPGLDTRRSELTSLPGTLETLTDACINQGGEIQKRKAFTLVGLTTNCFGLVSTGTALYTFGSVAPGSATFPSPVLYQQLTHPNGSTAMTAFVDGKSFLGYPLVLAEFADEYTFVYYNGTLVSDFVAGWILPYLNTNSLIAQALTALVNGTTNYTAIQSSSPTYDFSIYSLPNSSYAANTTVQSVSNITVTTNNDQSYTSGSVFATQGLNAGNNSTISIGGKVYTFVTTLTSVDGQIQIGGTISITLNNLFLAINNSGTNSTNYYLSPAQPNSNVYAQNYVSAGQPSFNIYARSLNTQGEIANSLLGLTYEMEAPTVSQAVAVQAIGQFKINAMQPATYASGTIVSSGTQPSGASPSVTVTGIQYNFVSTVANPNDVKIDVNTVAMMQNLSNAINGIVVSGKVGPGTVPNPVVVASTPYGSPAWDITVTAILPGANTDAITTSGTTHLTVSATLTGGVNASITGITVGPTFATGTLTTNGILPSDGDIVIIGSTTYTFRNSPSLTNDIQIATTALLSLTNLLLAINGTGTNNVNYIIAGPNTQVSALPSLNGSVLQVNSLIPGSLQNNIALSTSAIHTPNITASATTLLGGADSVQLLSAAVVALKGMSLASYTLKVSAGINAYSATSGYSSKVIGTTVYIMSVAGNSFSNNAVVTVTLAAGSTIAIGFCAFLFTTGGQVGSTTNPSQGPVGIVEGVYVDGFQVTTSTYNIATVNYITTLVQDLATDIITTAAQLSTGVTLTAVAVGNTLYISQVITASTDPILDVTIKMNDKTIATLTVSQVGADQLAAVVTPQYVGFLQYPAGGAFLPHRTLANIVSGQLASSGLINAPLLSNLLAGLFGSSPNLITADYSFTVVTCQATGGYAPYTYLWNQVSGANGFIPSAPTAASTTFSRKDNAGSDRAIWQCTVTDNVGNQVNSNPLTLYQP